MKKTLTMTPKKKYLELLKKEKKTLILKKKAEQKPNPKGKFA